MNRATLIKHLEGFHGAVPEMPFGPDTLVFKVSDKMFALVGDRDGVPGVNLKCDPLLSELLRGKYEAVIPGYHMNKKHWITVLLDDTVPSAEVLTMLEASYDLVLASLTRKKREALLQSPRT